MKSGREQSWVSEKGEGRRKTKGCKQLEMWSLRSHTERESAGGRWGVKDKSSKFPGERSKEWEKDEGREGTGSEGSFRETRQSLGGGRRTSRTGKGRRRRRRSPRAPGREPWARFLSARPRGENARAHSGLQPFVTLRSSAAQTAKRPLLPPYPGDCNPCSHWLCPVCLLPLGPSGLVEVLPRLSIWESGELSVGRALKSEC